ncbi:hypothetical protein GCM10010106_22140 [Thermopolyspora flexuosa]|nr:hypothetical protein GCM10010106_22140 [Thermopolyspora flexuosa]
MAAGRGPEHRGRRRVSGTRAAPYPGTPHDAAESPCRRRATPCRRGAAIPADADGGQGGIACSARAGRPAPSPVVAARGRVFTWRHSAITGSGYNSFVWHPEK